MVYKLPVVENQIIVVDLLPLLLFDDGVNFDDHEVMYVSGIFLN